MHENMKNNAKERIIWTYRLMERETLQEIRRKMTKICCGALPSGTERKRFEKFLKRWFQQVKSEFFINLILEIRLIETTLTIDRNRQRLHKNFKRNFD